MENFNLKMQTDIPIGLNEQISKLVLNDKKKTTSIDLYLSDVP